MATHAISQRRAGRLASVDPKTVRRERVPDCPKIRERMREIANERRRFGYRRIGVMLAREGIIMNHKRLRRLYREEGLAVRRRRAANARWVRASRCLFPLALRSTGASTFSLTCSTPAEGSAFSPSSMTSRANASA
jgi:putative transposase